MDSMLSSLRPLGHNVFVCVKVQQHIARAAKLRLKFVHLAQFPRKPVNKKPRRLARGQLVRNGLFQHFHRRLDINQASHGIHTLMKKIIQNGKEAN